MGFKEGVTKRRVRKNKGKEKSIIVRQNLIVLLLLRHLVVPPTFFYLGRRPCLCTVIFSISFLLHSLHRLWALVQSCYRVLSGSSGESALSPLNFSLSKKNSFSPTNICPKVVKFGAKKSPALLREFGSELILRVPRLWSLSRKLQLPGAPNWPTTPRVQWTVRQLRVYSRPKHGTRTAKKNVVTYKTCVIKRALRVFNK